MSPDCSSGLRAHLDCTFFINTYSELESHPNFHLYYHYHAWMENVSEQSLQMVFPWFHTDCLHTI